MSKTKEQVREEDWFFMEYKQNLNKQNKLKKKFEYLKEVDEQHFTAKYVYAQALEICDYINAIKYTPFKAWESYLKKDLEQLCDSFYIKENDYGELIPDEERIAELILPEPYNEARDRFGEEI